MSVFPKKWTPETIEYLLKSKRIFYLYYCVDFQLHHPQGQDWTGFRRDYQPPKGQLPGAMYHVWKSHHSLFNHLATADSDRLNMTKTQVMLDTWLHVNCLIPYGNEFFTIPEHAHHPNTTQAIRVLLLSLDEAYNKSQPSCLETRMFLKWNEMNRDEKNKSICSQTCTQNFLSPLHITLTSWPTEHNPLITYTKFVWNEKVFPPNFQRK